MTTDRPDNLESPLRLEEVGLTFKPGRGILQELAAGFKRLAGRPPPWVGIQAVRGVSLALRSGEVLG
jgi:hypothetical protein